MAPAALLRLGRRAGSQKGGSEHACVFAGMLEVEDRHRIGEVVARVFPNPCGSIPETHGDACPGVAAAQGFRAQEGAEWAAVLQGADIGGGLGEDAIELGFPGARGAVKLFACDALQLAAPERDARAVAGDLKDANGLAGGCRQGGLCLT